MREGSIFNVVPKICEQINNNNYDCYNKFTVLQSKIKLCSQYSSFVRNYKLFIQISHLPMSDTY